jgi:hypothetical protein
MRQEVSTKQVIGDAADAAVADGTNPMLVHGGRSVLPMLREAVHGQYLAIRERPIVQQMDKDIGLAGLCEPQHRCPSAAETVTALEEMAVRNRRESICCKSKRP